MSQILTDEEITLIIRECARGSAINRDGSTSHRIARAIEQAILNKLSEQEPVCYAFKNYGQWSVVAEAVTDPAVIPLYLHPAPSVPEGYQLVPKLSDYKMNDAGVGAFKSRSTVSKFCGFDWRDSEAIYIAMLSAAKE